MPPKLFASGRWKSLLSVSVCLSTLLLFVDCQEHTESNKLQLLNQTIERLRCNRELISNETPENKTNSLEHASNSSEVDESNETRVRRVNTTGTTTNHDTLSDSVNSLRYKQIKCESKRIVSVPINPDDFYQDKTHGQSQLYRVGNVTLHSDAFCIEKVYEKVMVIQLCRDTINQASNYRSTTPKVDEDTGDEDEYSNYEDELQSTKPTISTKKIGYFRKCCREDEKIQIDIGDSGPLYTCTPNKDEPVWDPALFPSVESNFSKHVHMEMGGSIHIHPNYSFGIPECSNLKALSNDKDTWFKVLEDGKVKIGLKFWFRPVWLLVEDQSSPVYCIDEVTKSTLQEETGINFSHPFASHHREVLHKNQILLYCKIHRFNEYLFHRKLFGTLCVLASVVFAIILGIYLSVWDKQNLAGWTQFSIFFALFFVFFMEGTRTLVDSNALLIKVTTSCRVIALIAQIFFFAVNTSWSVMCWDLFWTFWKLESTDKPLKEHPKRVTSYLFFSWVLPIIVVIIAFYYSDTKAHDARETMDGIYQDAHRRCSSPIRDLGFKTQGIMFMINALFFIFTAFLIWRHRSGIAASRRIAKSQRNNWRSVKLFGKLLIVMGVASLSVPIDYFFGSEDPLSPFAVILRCVHFIPVASILFIFGFNEKNIRLINQKYPSFGKTIGSPFCPTKGLTTDTNPSPSGQGQQITTIPAASVTIT